MSKSQDATGADPAQLSALGGRLGAVAEHIASLGRQLEVMASGSPHDSSTAPIYAQINQFATAPLLRSGQEIATRAGQLIKRAADQTGKSAGVTSGAASVAASIAQAAQAFKPATDPTTQALQAQQAIAAQQALQTSIITQQAAFSDLFQTYGESKAAIDKLVKDAGLDDNVQALTDALAKVKTAAEADSILKDAGAKLAADAARPTQAGKPVDPQGVDWARAQMEMALYNWTVTNNIDAPTLAGLTTSLQNASRVSPTPTGTSTTPSSNTPTATSNSPATPPTSSPQTA